MFLFLKRLSLIKVSVLGGITHNLMQLLAAALLTATPQVSYYLPFLLLTGAVCGFFIGILTSLVLNRVKSPYGSGTK